MRTHRITTPSALFSLALVACDSSIVRDSHDYGGGDDTWSDIAETGASLHIPAGAASATSLTAKAFAPTASQPEHDTIIGKVIEFGPDGTAFAPNATLTIPVTDTSTGVVISTMETGASAWTDLVTTVTATSASAPVAHFSRFALRHLAGTTFDAGTGDASADGGVDPNSPCDGAAIVATCSIQTSSSHTCTEVTGTPTSDEASLCGQAGGTWTASSAPCSQGMILGRCRHLTSTACEIAYYYTDGLTMTYAQTQCEAGGGTWF